MINEYKKALDILKIVLNLDKQYAKAYYIAGQLYLINLGISLTHLCDYKAALNNFNKA